MLNPDEARQRPNRKPSSFNRLGSLLSNRTNIPNLTRRRSAFDGNSMPVVTHDSEDDPFPTEGEEAPAVRVRDVFSGIFHHHHHSSHEYSQGDQVDVEHYIHDKSMRRKMILLSLSNSKIGIRIHFLRFFFCIFGALFYIAETIYFDYYSHTGYPLSEHENNTDISKLTVVRNQILALLFLNDIPVALWVLQIFDAFIIFCFACIIIYVTESWNLRNLLKLVDFSIFVMLLIPTLYFITLLYPPKLKNLFVPSFLYCWPAANALTAAIIQNIQRKKYHAAPNLFRVKVIQLVVFLTSFIFTWTCVIHHFFRIDQRTSLFDTYYFVMVTMSTVGFGDINVRHWTGRLLVTIFIISALVILIPKLEELYEAYQVQQKLHNSVSFTKAGRKHILICSTRLKPLVLRDFLTEFYSNPNNYDSHCVVLVEHEMTEAIQMYLSHPVWAKRITVLIGTPLRIADLRRARAQTAQACFVHTYRDHSDPHTADQHTIMSAWTIRDFAPQCQLFVQILKPENKIHLQETADFIMCEGELKNALLANNSHCPGINTLVTLFLHTFKPESRGLTSPEYKLYNKCAPCEIYDSRLGDSKYFHHFEGKNFLYTAVVAFRKYHVTLLAVAPAGSDEIKLNPGLNHTMHRDDICYFIGFSSEEYSRVGGATSISHTLKDVCASIAVISMITSGIDPRQFDERKMAGLPPEEHLDHHQLEDEIEPEKVNFFIPQYNSDESLHCPTPTKPSSLQGEAVGEAVHEARRGLQLLRYHSRMDMHANPVVKFKLNPTHHELLGLPTSTPKVSAASLPENQIHQLQINRQYLEPAEHIKMDHHRHFSSVDHPHSLVDHQLANHVHHRPLDTEHVSISIGEDVPDTGGGRPPTYTRHRPKPLNIDYKRSKSDEAKRVPMREFRSGNGFQRSLSDVFPAIPEEDETPDSPHTLKTTALYSSVLSLIVSPKELEQSCENPVEGSPSPNMRRFRFLHRPSAWSTMSVHSRHAVRANSGSIKEQDEDEDVVELELENLEEEEELEELEDGHCHDDGDTTDSREGSPLKSCASDEEPRIAPKKQRYEKGFLPISPYLGFEAPECHLVLHQRTVEQVHLIYDETTTALKDEVSKSVSRGMVIVYTPDYSEGLYHFILPLRAHYLSARSIKPLVIMMKKKPKDDFLEMLTWLPLIYYCVGELSSIDDWLKAGISIADTVVIMNDHSTLHHSTEELQEHMVDAAQIMATQKLAKLFPQVKIVTEIHYRYNVRFMKTLPCDMNMRNMMSMARKSDHLTYLFLPQFAAGRVFCSSMFDTLLFQNYMKPYMIEIVRQMLGCKEVHGSGFLWKMEMNKELMKLQTYDRVFQRLVSTHKDIPIGIYRTIPISECPDLLHRTGETVDTTDSDVLFLHAKMRCLKLEDTMMLATEPSCERYQSFVLPNPPPKTEMKPNDVILLLRCASSSKTTASAGPSFQVPHDQHMMRSHVSCDLHMMSGQLSDESPLTNERRSRSLFSPSSLKFTSSPKKDKGSPKKDKGSPKKERRRGVSVPVECYVTEC